MRLTSSPSLATLLQDGIKNNTTYKITVTGISDKAMKKLRVVMKAYNGKGGEDLMMHWNVPTQSIAAKKPFTYTTIMVSKSNAASVSKDLKRCWLRMSNPVDGLPRGIAMGNLMSVLTNVQISIEEVK